MRAFGRLLAVVGAVLIVVGVAAPMLGIGDFGVFPGILFLFAARLFTKRAKQEEMSTNEGEPERVLNTERRSSTPPPPRREPPRRYQPPPAVPEPVVDGVDTTQDDRESIFDSIILAGSELAGEMEADEVPEGVTDSDSPSPMTSAEMIAQARQRWDRRP